MSKLKNIFFLLLVIAIPVIIYLYFLQWKTTTVYGDDLYLFKSHAGLNSFSEKINLPNQFQKYRPMHGLSLHFLFEVVQKNVNGYYCFNIAIQAVNTFLFALIVNLFLRSPVLSLMFGLTLGLSRFSFFNIVQLLNGGGLEGLAITFFLGFLFYVIRGIYFDSDSSQKYRNIFKAILFANLCLYTHERYIVLLAFIVLLVVIYPGLRSLGRKQKIILSLVAIASIFLNVYIKTQVYDIPFFVGTGGTNIELAGASPAKFFMDGLLSILEINNGPDYLIGINFSELPFFNKSIVVLLLTGVATVFFLYLRNIQKQNISVQAANSNRFWIIPFLIILFGMLLAPAIVTIRLEQRWLQASLVIFLLSLAIAFNGIPFRNNYNRNGAFFLLLILWLAADFGYLKNGANNIYMAGTEKTANKFEEAIDSKIIRPGTNNLYIWEKQRDINTENEIKWLLAEGYFFSFYQQKEKKIIFADSSYQKNQPDSNSFINFNKNVDQVIYIANDIVDITDLYLKDSLKAFSDSIRKQ